MARILREANKTRAAEIAMKYRVCAQTIYNLRKHYGVTDADEAKQ